MPGTGAHAAKIAQAAASAWWKTHGTSRDEIPLGVVAALALTTRADPAGPDPASLILDANRDEIAGLLRRIWTLFAITRPELSIRTGPFADWLDDPSDAQLDGARSVIKAGQLKLTADRRAQEVDLLGRLPGTAQPQGRESPGRGLHAHGTGHGDSPDDTDRCRARAEHLRPLRGHGRAPAGRRQGTAIPGDRSQFDALVRRRHRPCRGRRSGRQRAPMGSRPAHRGGPGGHARRGRLASPRHIRADHGSNSTARGSPSPASSRPSAC